jgi:hypothetical protein
MKQAYKQQRFNSITRDIIVKANKIFLSYSEKGYAVTLRQLYYQFIAHDLFPESKRYSWNGRKWIPDKNGTKNCQPNYNFLGETMNNARLCGLVDWNYLHDLTRNLKRLSTWEKPGDIIESAAYQYRIDKWKYQNNYVEVWVEKDALIQIVGKAANKYEVPYFSCRGYTSQSEMHTASQRFIHRNHKKCIILHLGDHDPSGIDMSRDIQDRLKMFKAKVKVKRIALNMNQIKKYNPPPSPAKMTDSRYQTYIDQYGNDSWELDALSPDVIENLIINNIGKYIDDELWNYAILKENIDKKKLDSIVEKLNNDEL